MGFESQQWATYLLWFSQLPWEPLWDPACDTHLCFSCFLSCRMAAALPSLPKTAWEWHYHALRPCCHPRQMETIFYWQTGACSNPVERDEMVEQSKFLSFPLLSINILENTLEWEKNVPLSQSMCALNAHCSAGHLLTLAVSQDSCFSKRVTSLWTGSLLWETQSSLVFQVSKPSFHVCLFLH